MVAVIDRLGHVEAARRVFVQGCYATDERLLEYRKAREEERQ